MNLRRASGIAVLFVCTMILTLFTACGGGGGGGNDDSGSSAQYEYNSIWGTSANNMWVGDEGGWIRHWNGSSWTTLHSALGPEYELVGYWAFDMDNVWFVGNIEDEDTDTFTSTIMKWDGNDYSTILNDTTDWFMDIWAIDEDNVWVVGGEDDTDIMTVARWDGDSWSTENLTASALYGIWGTDANHIWVVGSTIYFYNGTNWTQQVSPASYTLTRVWGTANNDVWAIGGDEDGGGGEILHWDGTEWSVFETLASCPVGIWGSAADDVYVVGYDGLLMNWDGSDWSYLDSGTSKDLTEVWGTNSVNVWVVGTGITLH
jgi:hypothetical protein